MALVFSNRPRALHLSDVLITRAITPLIVLHSVQLLLLIIILVLNQFAYIFSLYFSSH